MIKDTNQCICIYLPFLSVAKVKKTLFCFLIYSIWNFVEKNSLRQEIRVSPWNLHSILKIHPIRHIIIYFEIIKKGTCMAVLSELVMCKKLAAAALNYVLVCLKEHNVFLKVDIEGYSW